MDCADHQPGWRQQAGRQRAMLIAYSPVTLSWLLPAGFLAGLADGVGQLFLGRLRPLLSTLFGWVWNLGMLPSTIGARRALSRVRQVGDEELFRFQVSGSVRLRGTLSELGERFSRAINEEEPDSLAERTVHAWSRPTAILVALSAIGVAIATREIWFAGTPAAGFSLPPADNLNGLVASYGGGWDASGLGGSAAAPPIAGLGSLANLVVGGRPEIAATLLTIASVVAGLAGTIRLARRAGASSGAGHVAAWVYIAGATSAALFGAGQWPLLLAAGSLPWALDAVLAPAGGDWRRRLGRYARGGLAAGWVAAAFPPALALVPAAAILWAIFTRRWFAIVTGLGITALGLGLVAPFVASGNLWPLLTAAPLPSPQIQWLWPVSVVAAIGVGALWVGRVRLGPLAFGGSLALGGWLFASWPGVLPGWGMVGWLGASIGGALLTAIVVEVAEGPTWRRLVAMVSVALFLVPAVMTAGGGRAGLPPDRWSDRLGFVTTLAETPSSTRVLLIGRSADLPGASRSIGTVSYRLIDGGVATLEQAYLPNFQAGDVRLGPGDPGSPDSWRRPSSGSGAGRFRSRMGGCASRLGSRHPRPLPAGRSGPDAGRSRIGGLREPCRTRPGRHRSGRGLGVGRTDLPRRADRGSRPPGRQRRSGMGTGLGFGGRLGEFCLRCGRVGHILSGSTDPGRRGRIRGPLGCTPDPDPVGNPYLSTQPASAGN